MGTEMETAPTEIKLLNFVYYDDKTSRIKFVLCIDDETVIKEATDSMYPLSRVLPFPDPLISEYGGEISIELDAVDDNIRSLGRHSVILNENFTYKVIEFGTKWFSGQCNFTYTIYGPMIREPLGRHAGVIARQSIVIDLGRSYPKRVVENVINTGCLIRLGRDSLYYKVHYALRNARYHLVGGQPPWIRMSSAGHPLLWLLCISPLPLFFSYEWEVLELLQILWSFMYVHAIDLSLILLRVLVLMLIFGFDIREMHRRWEEQSQVLAESYTYGGPSWDPTSEVEKDVVNIYLCHRGHQIAAFIYLKNMVEFEKVIIPRTVGFEALTPFPVSLVARIDHKYLSLFTKSKNGRYKIDPKSGHELNLKSLQRFQVVPHYFVLHPHTTFFSFIQKVEKRFNVVYEIKPADRSMDGADSSSVPLVVDLSVNQKSPGTVVVANYYAGGNATLNINSEGDTNVVSVPSSSL